MIYSADYRIFGTIHLLPKASTAELLNQERSHLALTEVTLGKLGYEFPLAPDKLKARSSFTLVRKSEIQWVAGGRPIAPRVGATLTQLQRRRLAFFLGDYILAGELDITKEIRLSDFMAGATAKNFQTLHKAAVYPLPANSPVSTLTPALTYEFVTVNMAAAGSVVEIQADENEMALDLLGELKNQEPGA